MVDQLLAIMPWYAWYLSVGIVIASIEFIWHRKEIIEYNNSSKALSKKIMDRAIERGKVVVGEHEGKKTYEPMDEEGEFVIDITARDTSWKMYIGDEVFINLGIILLWLPLCTLAPIIMTIIMQILKRHNRKKYPFLYKDMIKNKETAN